MDMKAKGKLKAVVVIFNNKIVGSFDTIGEANHFIGKLVVSAALWPWRERVLGSNGMYGAFAGVIGGEDLPRRVIVLEQVQ